MRRWMWSIGLVGVVSGACDEPSSTAPPSASAVPVVSATTTIASASAAPLPAPKPPAIDDEAARELVGGWLRAQNAKRFEDYAKLYAKKFTGIKRMGARTSRYDRDGWLKDRKLMFARGFQVSASEINVATMGPTTVATFDQIYTSPTFTDRGPKQLVLAKEGDDVVIVREEMLRSDVERAGADASVLPEGFAFVRHAGGRSFVVVSLAATGMTILGEPRFLGHGAAWGPIDAAKLPEEVAARRGSAVVAHEPGGKRCDAKLETWGVLAEFEPHFGMVQEWTGALGGDAVPEEQIARDVFGPSAVDHGRLATHRIVADITEAIRACPEALWVAAPGVKPVYYEFTTELAPFDAKLRPLLRKTASYRSSQESFRRDYGGKGSWDVTRSASFFGMHATRGEDTFVFGRLDYFESCGDFSGFAGAVLRLTGGQWLTLPGEFESTFSVEHVVDLNGDGIPEWLSSSTVVGWDGAAYRMLLDTTPISYDCPC